MRSYALPRQINYADCGSQYCCHACQQRLAAHGVTASTSGNGSCSGNAMAAAVFKTIRNGLIWRTIFHARAAAECALGRCIDGFYNPLAALRFCDTKRPGSFKTEMDITG